MRHLLLWSQQHPRAAALVLALGSALALWFAPAVQIDTSLKALMVENDPAVAVYHDTCERFGIDSVTVVCLRDPDLFTPDRLTALGRLTEDLQGVPGVHRVESLATVSNIRHRDGLLHTGPLLDWPVESPAAADRVRDDARRNPLLARTLVSPDQPVTAINVYLRADARDPQFFFRVHDGLEARLAAYRPMFAEIFQLGTPFRIASERASILRDQFVQIPAAVLVLVLVLILATRSPRIALLPLLTAGLSILWTVGFMGLAGLPVTLLTFMVPSLVLVIGSTEDIHIACEYLDARRRGLGPAAAVTAMIEEIGSTLTFTAGTTCLGFASIALSPMTGLREFGYAAGFGLLANPVITALLTPLYLQRLAGATCRPAPPSAILERLHRATVAVVTRCLPQRGLVVAAAALAALGGAWLGTRLETDNNLLAFFRPRSEIIRRSNLLDSALAGGGSLFLRITGGAPGAFQQPANLSATARLLDALREEPGLDAVIGLPDWLRLIHRELHAGDPAFDRVPESPATIAEYLLFLSPADTERFVTPDFAEANLVVRHNLYSSRALGAAIDRIASRAREILPPGLELVPSGELFLVHRAADAIVAGQLRSLAFVAVPIAVWVSLMFRTVRAGVVAMLANLIPVAITFGLMYLAAIPLNTATSMVAAIGIGIAVDDTAHLMVRFRRHRRGGVSPPDAMFAALQAEFRPICSTSLALAAGFLVLLTSHFVPIAQFGLLSAVLILVALLTELVLTPLLLVLLLPGARRPVKTIAAVVLAAAALWPGAARLAAAEPAADSTPFLGAQVATSFDGELELKLRQFLTPPSSQFGSRTVESDQSSLEGRLTLSWRATAPRWGAGLGGWAEYGTHDDAWAEGFAPGQDRALHSRPLVLNQAFVELYGDAFDLTAGKQFLRQGVGRIFSPLDRYSPYDYREPVEREAFGVWQLRGDWYPMDSFTLSLTVLPVYQPPKLPDPESPWILDTSSFAAAAGAGDLHPDLTDSSPRVGFANTSLLLQQRTTGTGWDWCSSVYYGWRPTLRGALVAPATVRVVRDATRALEIGNGLSLVTGLYEWHAEAVYSRPEHAAQDEYVSFLVGMTRNLEELTNWLQLLRASVTVEYAGEWLVDDGPAAAGPDLAEALRFGQETFLAQLSIAPDDDWALRLTGVHQTDGDGTFLRGSVDRRITGSLTVGLAFDLFLDTRRGPYANWNDNDRVTVVARYTF